MNKNYFLVASLLLLASCGSEDFVTEGNTTSTISGGLTIVAKTENSTNSSKLNFNDKGKTNWQSGDKIAVWLNNEQKNIELKSGAETSSAMFSSGDVNGTLGKYAVYPSDNVISLDGSTLTYTLPSSYTYSINSTSFYENDNCKIPMAATVAEGEDYNSNKGFLASFKNICGIIAVKVTSTSGAIKSVKLTSTDTNIAGTATMDLQNLGSRGLSITSGSKEITITPYGSPTEDYFFFPVPVGNNAYTVTVVTANKTKNTSSKTINVERGKVHMFSVAVKADYPDNTSIDGYTFYDMGTDDGILWANKPTTSTATWANASAACNGKIYRLPTKAEVEKLATLFTKTSSTSMTNNGHTLRFTVWNYYWTTTSFNSGYYCFGVEMYAPTRKYYINTTSGSSCYSWYVLDKEQ